MSTVTTVLNNGNYAHFDYDVSKTFIRNNRFRTETFLNDTGSALTLAAGNLLGKIGASDRVVALQSAAADGSQFPYGVLAEPITSLANAGTIDVAVCIAGDVAEEKLLLDGSDTLETVISSRTIRDRIHADTVGIILVASDELSGFDNQ